MKFDKRLALSTVLAATIGVTGATTAFGTPANPTIDNARNGTASVTIVKHARTDTNGLTPATGEQLNNVDGKTLADATFTLKKVKSIGGTDISGLNLTTNEGWEKLSSLIDANNQPKGDVVYDEGSKVELTTKADGVAKFEKLGFGLYYVQETKAPAGASPAAPFYITAPLWVTNTDEAAGGHYLYDSFVYPKNTVDNTNKTVKDDTARGVGSDVDYTVTTSVTPYTAPDGTERTKYVVTDQLDSRLTYKSADVSLSTGDKLEADTDYKITSENNLFKLEFTPAGITKLNNAAKADTTLKTVIHTTLDADSIKDVVNKAILIPNQDPKWNEGGIPTPEVKTELGKVELTKVDASNPDAKLKNAVFEIHDMDGNKLTFYDGKGNKVTQVSTGEDGKAVFSGLRVSDWENGGAVTGDAVDKYQIVEVKAPEGYGLLPEPITVTLSNQDGADGSVAQVTAKDPKSNVGFKLPVTGAQGVMLMLVGGAVMVVAGTGIYMASHKRTKKSEA